MKAIVGNVERPFVSIKLKHAQGYNITWGYNVFTRKEDDGRISCYIPGFEIYYSVMESEQTAPKGIVMTKFFFDHLLSHSSLKNFALEMHKRGFKAPKDAYVLKQLMNNQLMDVKFKSILNDTLPEGFSDSEMINQKSEMEVDIPA